MTCSSLIGLLSRDGVETPPGPVRQLQESVYLDRHAKRWSLLEVQLFSDLIETGWDQFTESNLKLVAPEFDAVLAKLWVVWDMSPIFAWAHHLLLFILTTFFLYVMTTNSPSPACSTMHCTHPNQRQIILGIFETYHQLIEFKSVRSGIALCCLYFSLFRIQLRL